MATTVTVDAAALREVLVALTGPGHLIRELQATMSLHELGHPNAIRTLVDQFNEHCDDAQQRQGAATANDGES